MYLSYAASNGDLERSFSSAGFLNEGRWSLLPENLEMQVVIRDYLLDLERKPDYMQNVQRLIGMLRTAPPAPPAAAAAPKQLNQAQEFISDSD